MMKHIFGHKLWYSLLLLLAILLSNLAGILLFGKETVLAESFTIIEEVDARDYLSKRFPKASLDNWDFASCPTIPLVNSKWEAADEVNAIIEEKLEEFLRVIEVGEIYVQAIEYEEYRYGDLIAVEFTAYIYGMEYFNENQIFQFQLPAGKLLRNEDILKQLGFSDRSAMEVFEDSLCANYHPKSTFNYPPMNRFSRSVLAKMILDSWQEGNRSYNLYFNDCGKLFFHYQNPSFGVYHIEALVPQKTVDLRLNPLYEQVALNMDLDPYQDDAPFLLVAFLGQVNSGDELGDVLALPEMFLYEHEIDEAAGLLFDVEFMDYGFERLAGNEFYFVIPRYERQVINIMYIEDANPETMKSLDGNYEVLPATVGKCAILAQNWRGEERIYANGSFYRDREMYFALELNSNNELINLPFDIVDFSDYLHSLELPEYTWYDMDIYDELVAYIGMG